MNYYHTVYQTLNIATLSVIALAYHSLISGPEYRSTNFQVPFSTSLIIIRVTEQQPFVNQGMLRFVIDGTNVTL